MKEVFSYIGPKAPTGSRFLIDSCEFRPGTPLEVEHLDLADNRLLDWPMVYILANDREAYVGQTTSVVRRMAQHGDNPEKRAFNRVNIIYNAESNMSVVTDYESRLIRYMSADGRYVLTNKNEGISEANYFSKAEYDKMFEALWAELRDMELADHTIAQIEESEVFKYSPYKSLNADQRAALSKIMTAVRTDTDSAPIVVEGLPGTGKTVLAIYLLKALRDLSLSSDPKDSQFHGWNVRILEPVTSLRETLRKSLSGVQNLSKWDVLGPSDLVKERFTGSKSKKPFDVLLVDETHRLKQRKNIMGYYSFDKTSARLGFTDVAHSTQLDWVLHQARIPIFFYDPMQVVGPSGIGPDIMRDRLGAAFERPIRLASQMRVKGGDAYLDYVADVLWDRDPKPRRFDGYEFVFHESFADFHDTFDRYLELHDLTRMVAGYAWKWVTKNNDDPNLYDIDIDGFKIRWNCQQENWVGLGVDNREVAHEMGVIHSIQGYDLSYAFVVIGPDLSYDESAEKIVVNRASYFDVNGKKTASEKDLAEYVRHIYYVLMTRGILGTHVYVCDEKLRDHLRKYFPAPLPGLPR